MKNYFAKFAVCASASVIFLCGGLNAEQSINGAGATFPAPCYQKWISEYSKVADVKINYQAIGSSGGLAQIRAKTVDFGASDEPLHKEELDKDGLIQFPAIMGAIVVIVNIPGIKAGELRLTGEILADIYMGKIKSWSDQSIVKINEGISLPDLPITVVRRADGSGTTWNFTNYLSKKSDEWSKNFGCSKEIKWFDRSVGGQKNQGVAALVAKIKGAIGYVESAYAFQGKMTYTQLRNKDGKYVLPTTESFQQAVSNADWQNAPGYYMILTDQPGEKSWPIMASSYILLYKNQTNAGKIKTILDFFIWALNHGEKIAEKLDYVPMPKNVVGMIIQTLKNEIKADGKAVLN